MHRTAESSTFGLRVPPRCSSPRCTRSAIAPARRGRPTRMLSTFFASFAERRPMILPSACSDFWETTTRDRSRRRLSVCSGRSLRIAPERGSRWPSGRSVHSAIRRKSPPPARYWLVICSEPWAVEPIELAHGSASHDRGRQILPASSSPARSGVSDQTWRAVFSAGGGDGPETVPQPWVAPCTKYGFPPAEQMPSRPLRECRHWPVSRCMISRTLFSGRTTSNGKQNSVSPWPATLSLNSYRRGE